MTTENVAQVAPAESTPANESSNAQPANQASGNEANVTQNTQDPSQQQDPAQTPPPGPKPQSRTQQRIDQLTRERYEEQRAREAAEAQLHAIQRQHQLTQQFSQLDSEAPDINQFNDLHSYNRAMADWTTRRAAAIANAQWEQRMQQERAQNAQFSQQALAQQHAVMRENVLIEEKMAAGVKKYPDFMAVITNPELPTVRGTPLFAAVLAAENAVDIAYSLAKNPAEMDRLLAVRDPMIIAREVFRLDAKFSGSGTSNAPPPPPSRNGSPQVVKSRDQMTDAEWLADRERELQARSA